MAQVVCIERLVLLLSKHLGLIVAVEFVVRTSVVLPVCFLAIAILMAVLHVLSIVDHVCKSGCSFQILKIK